MTEAGEGRKSAVEAHTRLEAERKSRAEERRNRDDTRTNRRATHARGADDDVRVRPDRRHHLPAPPQRQRKQSSRRPAAPRSVFAFGIWGLWRGSARIPLRLAAHGRSRAAQDHLLLPYWWGRFSCSANTTSAVFF